MDEKDIIERLGPPDKIIGRRERTRSREWQGSRCKLTITNDTPIAIPAPCPACGRIAFEAIEQPLSSVYGRSPTTDKAREED